jgi:signal transduction histidine kinase
MAEGSMRRSGRLCTFETVPTDGITGLQERLARSPVWAIDAALATVIVIASLLTTAGRTVGPGVVERRDALAFVLVLAATLPYFLRRRAPLVVLIWSAVAVVLLMIRGDHEGALPFVLLVGAYTVGAYRPAREVAVGGAILGASLVVLLASDTGSFGAGEFVSTVVAFGMAMLVGWTMQSRRRRIDAFEGEQEQAALRAAADERLRIAQEVHDVVAHSLGVIAVQAAVGMKVIDSDPEEARRSFENISRTSRSSLAEIRRVLGMVRNAQGGLAYTPAPGLADLARLTSEVAGAGLPVDVDVDGNIEDVPAGVGLAAYRIIQEALTNVLRHAAAHHATVRLDSTSGRLVVEVTDDGRGPNGRRARGHGLVGMRERVAVYGGSLDVGAGPSGGFRVTARLPYDPGQLA